MPGKAPLTHPFFLIVSFLGESMCLLAMFLSHLPFPLPSSIFLSLSLSRSPKHHCTAWEIEGKRERRKTPERNKLRGETDGREKVFNYTPLHSVSPGQMCQSSRWQTNTIQLNLKWLQRASPACIASWHISLCRRHILCFPNTFRYEAVQNVQRCTLSPTSGSVWTVFAMIVKMLLKCF